MANQLLWGFYDLRDYAGLRSIEIDRGALTDAIVLSAEQYNAEVRMMTRLFCTETTAFRKRFRSQGNPRLQPGDQFSRAKPVKRTTYDVDLPIQKGDHAWGANFMTRAKRTVQDDNDDTAYAFAADRNWMADHILAALFYNGSGWSNVDDENGTLTIKGLANGDTVVYGRLGAAPATDNHYYAQAAAIADASNPFPAIKIELMEHPENAGATVVTFVASTNRAAVEALQVFSKPDDNALRIADTLTVLVEDLGVDVPGSLVGYVNGQYVYEWPRLPSDYGISLAVGAASGPPLAMREDPEPELRDFRFAGVREDYPYRESQMFRFAGFGSWNRVGAVAWRVGNASWAIPTGMGSPMR